jgi:thioredoxin-like negative regulator of GroEL
MLVRAALHSPALASYAGQFVWLEVNIDAAENEAFLSKNAVNSIPMVFMFDPKGELLTNWFATANVDDIKHFLDLASRSAPPGSPEEALHWADLKYAAGDGAGAAPLYKRAIDLGGSDWPDRQRAQELLAGSLALADPAGCVTMVDATAPTMPRTHSFSAVVLFGLGCAIDPAAHASPNVVDRIQRLSEEALSLPASNEDDRNGFYDGLYFLRAALHDPAGALHYGEELLRYVKSLPPAPNESEELRSGRNRALLRGAMRVHDVPSVIPQLEAAEQSMPDRYQEAHNLGDAYVATKRYKDAIAAYSRGLAKHPRGVDTSLMLLGRAEAEMALGDNDSAKADLLAARDAVATITPAARKMWGQDFPAQIAKDLETLSGKAKKT